MIDYAKIELPAEVGTRLLQRPDLSFIGKFDHATGAVVGDAPCVAEYGPPVAIGPSQPQEHARCALQFKVYPSGRTILHGSVHKYAQGGTNWGDFTFAEFAAAIADLCRTFDLSPDTMRLLQLEAGANVEPPQLTAKALSAIVCHGNGKAFGPMTSTQGRPLGIIMRREQYAVKVYDKGRQYGLAGELLRFELKYHKAAPFRSLGIATVNDLLNPQAWHRLRGALLSTYDQLFVYERSIDRDRLTRSQRTFVEVVRAPVHWLELTRNARHKARLRYADIVTRFAAQDLKAQLRQRLVAKLNDLLNVPGPSPAKGDVFANIPGDLRDPERRRFPGSIKVANRPQGDPGTRPACGGSRPYKPLGI